ncbi:hypothetical protein DPEC_G00107940 [Dallia pectoralis]|uniref:Uncharacterized protein n=1 Tax=Dallia pectoralis TaxID=75939 RepID=A0ACC2GSV1_DALPE|nr:hypothetical protein DPEC_G00107940 [Dallia pectoralis]
MANPQVTDAGSYTVVIIPLRSSLSSLDALDSFLWIKRLKDLEMEKDFLWAGIEVLEQVRLWYQHRLKDCGSRQSHGALSGLLRSQIHKVNGSLGCLISEPNMTRRPCSQERTQANMPDSDMLCWQNTVLAQEVCEKNLRISLLQLEKDSLLRELCVHLDVKHNKYPD